MEMISQNFSSDHKLINFNVPKYLIKNFDNLVKFKRVSRTSMLIHLMEDYIRSERVRMKNDHTLTLMINDIELRNRQSLKDEIRNLQKEIEDQITVSRAQPVSQSKSFFSSDDWYETDAIPRLENVSGDTDWDDPSGVKYLWNK